MTEPDPTRGGPPYENFSAGYTLVTGVDVRTWTDDLAVMDVDLYESLGHIFGTPLIGYIGGQHYQLKPQRNGVPPDTVAVPKDNHRASEPDNLLIQKPSHR